MWAAAPALACLAMAGDPPAGDAAQAPKPSVTLLYDTLVDPSVVVPARQTRALPLMIAYQYCSPDAQKTGRIDVGAVLMCIDRMTSGEPPEWGMLDFEYGFTDRMQKGLTPEARVARDEMVKLIRAVRAAYPRTKWTYYGVPFLPYWMEGKSWSDASEPQKRQVMESCAEMYAPLVAECDWVSPSIYPVYDPSMFKPYEQSGVRAAGVAWRSAQVGFARLLAAGKPVIPTVSPVWQPGGLAAAGTVVPPRQFVQDQVQPALRAGAAGVAVWTSYGKLIDQKLAESPEAAEAGEFPRKNLVKAFLDGREPQDWKDPAVAEVMRRDAARVVLRSLRDVRACEAGTVPEASAPLW
jgi:hypothetical protein